MLQRIWSGSVLRLSDILLRLPALVLLACLAQTAWAADYRLDAGDTLEITVFRMPEISRSVTVDVDGRIAFPPLGRVPVSGRTPEEVSAALGDALVQEQILTSRQVTVAVTTPRPFFVGGDVATPGAFPYRPGLTVRRAVALAGGVGLARERRPDQLPELHGERELAVLDRFREQIRLSRVEAALAGRGSFEPPVDPTTLASGALAVLELERNRLVSDETENAREREHLTRDMELIDARIETLRNQATIQSELMLKQGAEIERIRGLQDRGLTSQTRVTDELRAYEAMQERAAATASEISSVRGLRETAHHALDRFDDRRRGALAAERQAALLALEMAEARIRALDGRLAQVGVDTGDAISIALYRQQDGREVRLAADEGTVLEPGDLVEVTIDMSRFGAAPPAPRVQ